MKGKNEGDGPATGLDPEPDRRKRYWRRFRQTRRRVYGSLTHEDYAALKARADAQGRHVWEQVWAESQAYVTRKAIPSHGIEAKLTDVTRTLRGAASNINQIARYSNRLRRVFSEKRIIERVQAMEQAVHDFTHKSRLFKDDLPDERPHECPRE